MSALKLKLSYQDLCEKDPPGSYLMMTFAPWPRPIFAVLAHRMDVDDGDYLDLFQNYRLVRVLREFGRFTVAYWYALVDDKGQISPETQMVLDENTSGMKATRPELFSGTETI